MAKGTKTGGRRKGVPNKATQAAKALRDKALAEGVTPLEVMLQTMRALWEAGDQAAASQVAKDAAPYVHPKLAQIDNTHKGELTIVRKMY